MLGALGALDCIVSSCEPHALVCFAEVLSHVDAFVVWIPDQGCASIAALEQLIQAYVCKSILTFALE